MVSVNRDQYCVVRRNVKWEPLKRAIIWLGYSGSVRWRRRRLDEKEICGNRYAYSLYRDWLVWWPADEGILGRMQMMRWENDTPSPRDMPNLFSVQYNYHSISLCSKSRILGGRRQRRWWAAATESFFNLFWKSIKFQLNIFFRQQRPAHGRDNTLSPTHDTSHRYKVSNAQTITICESMDLLEITFPSKFHVFAPRSTWVSAPSSCARVMLHDNFRI